MLINTLKVYLNDTEIPFDEIETIHEHGSRAVMVIDMSDLTPQYIELIHNHPLESARIESESMTYGYEDINNVDVSVTHGTEDTTFTVHLTADDWSVTEF